GVLALGLANVILKSGARKASDAGRAGMLIDGWAGGLTEFTPQDVEKKTGVAAAKIERLAKEFVEQQPGLAVIAGAAVAKPDVLLDVAKRLGKPIDLKWKSFEEMIQEPAATPKVETAKAPTVAAVKYSEPRFDGDANQFGFHFLPYPSIAFLDGSLAHLPL